jgi:N4-(beta-N-acetylglucosaminyl)-L-asparaginase
MPDRRDFLRTSALVGMGAALGQVPTPGAASPARASSHPPAVHRGRAVPAAVGSSNALPAVTRALEGLERGEEVVEAAVRGVMIVEADPADRSVGYGGLPNREGVVQLDASVMHGPTRGAGAVGALEGIKHPSLVALDVMRYTDHVFLVGEGAQRFALSMGFQLENLLTEESRLAWVRWRAGLSDEDDYLRPDLSGEEVREFRRWDDGEGSRDPGDDAGPQGTIHCSAVDGDGNLGGVTTTSGLAWKLPGRVGDSPLIGAGLYLDNDVGAAGSTGRGEAVIKTCGTHTVVEEMRRGESPTDACLEALRRILRWTVEPRLLDEEGRPNFNVNFYAVNRRGEVGGAALWSGSVFAANVDGDARIHDSAYLLERA